MKKMSVAARKNAPKFVDDTHVQVTREFAKNARIFGTPEYKMWREIRQDCPEAEMVLKNIKKKEYLKSGTDSKRFLWIGKQHNSLIDFVEVSLIAMHIGVSFVYFSDLLI